MSINIQRNTVVARVDQICILSGNMPSIKNCRKEYRILYKT